MIKIKDNIYWVGIKDWELKKFHGDEYSTHRGSTYNSYLIKDKRTALVDRYGLRFTANLSTTWRRT